MKKAAYILLIIGILGIVASIINWMSGDDLSNIIISLICSISLIYGFYELRKVNK